MPKLTWEKVSRRDPRQRPLVMGHRGAPDDRPENTLGSFALALEQGADVLETDVHFTSDDAIVLMHDATVDRTTYSSGPVGGMTLAEFKRLRARWAPMMGKDDPAKDLPSDRAPGGKRDPRWEEAPPSLQDLLEMTRGDTPLALELKDDRFLNPADAHKLVDLLTRYNALESTVLVSFSLPRLQTFREIRSGLKIGQITMNNPLPLPPTEFLGPFYPLLYFNPLYVAWAKRLGRIVCPLDIEPESRLGYYRFLGLTLVMTNHPGKTVEALRRLYNPQ